MAKRLPDRPVTTVPRASERLRPQTKKAEANLLESQFVAEVPDKLDEALENIPSDVEVYLYSSDQDFEEDVANRMKGLTKLIEAVHRVDPDISCYPEISYKFISDIPYREMATTGSGPTYSISQGPNRLAVWQATRQKKTGSGTFQSFSFKMTKRYLTKTEDGQAARWGPYMDLGAEGWRKTSAPSKKLEQQPMWRDTNMYDVRSIPDLIYMLDKTYKDHVKRYPELRMRAGVKGGFKDGKDPGKVVAEERSELLAEMQDSQQRGLTYRGMFPSQTSQMSHQY